MQTVQPFPRPQEQLQYYQPRGSVGHRSARAPRPNRNNAPRPVNARNSQWNPQLNMQRHSHRPRLGGYVEAPRPPSTPHQPLPVPSELSNTEHTETNILNHLGDLVTPATASPVQERRAPPVDRTIELVDDPIDIITISSIFGLDEDESEEQNNEITSDPFYPVKSQYERTIQELKVEKKRTEKLLQSKIEISDRRIQDLEKYEQLLEHCSLEQIRNMSLDGCTAMKKKVRSLLFALEHEELRLIKEKVRKDCYEDLYFCLICQEQERNVSFDPCGHFCLCHGCVETKNVTICPICRADITERRRIYLG